jgi:hypothetical protein
MCLYEPGAEVRLLTRARLLCAAFNTRQAQVAFARNIMGHDLDAHV